MTNTDTTAQAAATPASTRLKFIVGEDATSEFKKHMRSYAYFDSPEELTAKVNEIAKKTENFGGLATDFRGFEYDAEKGEYVLMDPAPYADSVSVLAYVGGQAKDSAGKAQPVIKGVLAFGIPTVESALNGAPDLVSKVLGKEFRHVYFRNFRDAESREAWEAGSAAAPVGIEAFAASHARTAAEEQGDETFDAIWTPLRRTWGKEQKALVDALPSKAEIVKAIRSKSYAQGVYPELESKNIFIMVAATVVKIAKSQETPLDVSGILAWVQSRETTHIAFKTADFDALSAFDANSAMADLGLNA